MTGWLVAMTPNRIGSDEDDNGEDEVASAEDPDDTAVSRDVSGPEYPPAAADGDGDGERTNDDDTVATSTVLDSDTSVTNDTTDNDVMQPGGDATVQPAAASDDSQVHFIAI